MDLQRVLARLQDLAGMLEDGRSEARRRDFEAGRSSVRGAERRTGLTDVLAWNERIRSLFGDRPPSRRRWLGDDFRL
jgi:hypothetical protein